MVGLKTGLVKNLLPLLGFVVTLLIQDVQPADKMVFPDEVARQSRQANDGCDITVNEEEGWIFTPNYPSNYDNQRDCTYVIKKWRRNVCQVQVTINDFDLGDSSNCHADYLDIRQGSPNAGARLICGSLPSGTKKKLTFPRGRESMTLRFHSDVSQTFKGFMIKIKQIPNSCNRREDPDDKPVPPVNCDRYLADYSGVFTSPNYPDSYPSNSRCRYTLQKPERSVCKVEVVFRSFELEQSPSCRNDFLELPGGARLCGVYLTPAVLEYLPGTNSMAMTFFTDSYGNAPGFEAEFRQLRNSCGRDRPPKPENCDRVIWTPRDHIVSPNYPFGYPHRQRCRYSIQRYDRSVCAVRITLIRFELLGSAYGCHGSHLTLPDGNRLCGFLTGQKTLYFDRDDKYMVIEFVSDGYGYQGRGFDIGVTQLPRSCGSDDHDWPGPFCDQQVVGYDGRITSPGFPAQYTPNQKCTYTIRRSDPSVCTVMVDFNFFDVEISSRGCERDYLEMPDKTRLCGSVAGQRVYKYPPGSGTLQLHFHADSFGAGRGFDLKIRQRPNSCGSVTPGQCDKLVDLETDLIRSPNYPSDYPNGARCEYTIEKAYSDVCEVRLDFLDFDLAKPDGRCDSDYLEIENLQLKLCGRDVPLEKIVYFPPSSDSMQLVFKSNSYQPHRGFEIRVTQLRNSCYKPQPIVDDDDGICGTIRDFSATIQSDNYPRVYNPNTDCAYKVIRASQEVCRVELNFVQFDVGKGSNSLCVGDYLEVPGSGRHCGLKNRQTISVDFPSNQRELTIRFKTDSYDQRSGFRIEIRQLTHGCGGNVEPNRNCGGTYKDDNFDLISPGFQGGSYPPNEECRYVLKKSSYDVCAIEIKYNVFDVEESDDCTKDFVEIGDQKVCGKLPFDSSRTYEFPDDTLIIRFRSDNFGKNAGFFMTVKQKKC